MGIKNWWNRKNNNGKLAIAGTTGVVVGYPTAVYTNTALAGMAVKSGAAALALGTANIMANVAWIGGAVAMGTGFYRGMVEGFNRSLAELQHEEMLRRGMQQSK